MHDFVGDLLKRIENSGENFSWHAYSIVSSEITPLLTLMFIAYVGYYGIQAIMGTTRIGLAEIVTRVLRMIFILALINKWEYFNSFFYRWLNNTPEDVGRAILTATSTGIMEPTSGLSLIWKTANEAASVFAEQTGYFSILPSMVGFLIMACVAIFVSVALAILVLAKVMLWVLIGTAPIFIACMLFEQSRSVGQAWFRQLLLYSLIPMFVFVVAAFLIAALDPELAKVSAAAAARRLTLSDISAFLLLCLAGAFVLWNVRLLAHGIAEGLVVGISETAARVARFSRVGVPVLFSREGSKVIGASYRGGHPRDNRFGDRMQGNSLSSTSLGIKEAMQNRISRNSLPR
ncbi:type IV secretion system protein [Brucella intermedia]|uniref:type IV secretion system protein n=1 Tax=Brucella intermedia TaxID=94625 RepID=UPI00046A0A42|nr:type IV secretion system protein [Brucella intermedia]